MAKKKARKGKSKGRSKRKGDGRWQASRSTTNGSNIDYNGPSELKSFFEVQYAAICHLYDRRKPTIVAGIPHLPEGKDIEVTEFRTQEELNAYANPRIRELKKLVARVEAKKEDDGSGRDRQIGKKKLERLVQIGNELKPVSFVGRGFSMLAGYSPVQDACYFDVSFTALYIIDPDLNDDGLPLLERVQDKKAISIREMRNVPSHMKHELAHYDIGLCTFAVEERKQSQRAIEFTAQYLNIKQGIDEGRTYEELCEEYGVNPDFDRMYKEECEEDLETRFENTLTQILAELTTLREESEKLGIGLLNEAIAYNYAKERVGYKEWIKKDGHDIDTWMQVYDQLTDEISEKGELETLRYVRKIIDQAWEEKTPCVGLLAA